ncbi:MAG: response regulator [Deltaproteobacteria bacterium]|nr:response regulator [Deltaproteobacteria bacterium]
MAAITGWEILIIDDEEDILDILSLALKDVTHHISVAQDGASGLKVCEEKSPQIVITDIRMPVMDGLQVLEILKKRSPEIEVIVATAFGEIDTAIRALQLDASDFITKPINTKELYLAINRAKERYLARKQLAEYTALLEKEKAETHQELIKTFDFQKNLIESSMDGILANNEKGEIVIFNKSMEHMLSYTKADVLHKMTLSQFMSREDESALKTALESEKFGGFNRLILFETSLLDRSGRKIPVQVSGTGFSNQDESGGFVFFFRDLRELRKLEYELSNQASILHQDKMMSMGRLAASVVHEINNPLSGILNYLRLMIRIVDRGPLAEDQREKFREYLDIVENETGRCSKIVSNLLTFSRKSPVNFEEISIADLIDKCVALSNHKLELQKIRFEIHAEPSIPLIEGDFNQLQQCIINLIFNAIDAMPDGGVLTLSADYDPSGKSVRIIIKDTGHGISEEDLPHIFEPFFTTKAEGYGVGLGLSTVYGILERHKGTVEARSLLNEGSIFTIRLPAAQSNLVSMAI